jgi:hypothetical protein
MTARISAIELCFSQLIMTSLSSRAELLRTALCVALAAMAACVAARAQQPVDADSALARTRERLLADLERMPHYTCVQTITRQYYETKPVAASCARIIADHGKNSEALKLRGWDRLRLEVAIVDGNNVYSWVGAARFQGDTLGLLAGRGPLSSGDFGPVLYLLFNRATITFKEEDVSGNKRLLAYSYDVPLARSSYKVHSKDGLAVTAYSGTFLLDPVGADIVSLTVQTAELPEGVPDCQFITGVDYTRTEIHDRVVLIPRQTSLVAIDRNGGEVRNLTTYASCREYASKSRMLPDAMAAPAATTAGAPAPQPAPDPVPAGVHFRARIITPIDSDTSAAGDPIEAVLLSPMRSKDHEWAPARARLHGRLLALEQHITRQKSFRVLVQFESIEIDGQSVPLRAEPDLSALSGLSTAGGPFRTEISVFSNNPARDNSGFISRQQHLHLDKFDWSWTTLPASAREEKSGDAR